jgi:hypothetical protein
MLSFFYKYLYSDYENELRTIAKQRKLRHLLHRQINTSNLKLKSVKPVIKTGFWDLERQISIPIPVSKKRKRI